MNRKKSILFFYRFAGHFLLFAFPAGTFQQAYGSSSQEKQPTEIRPAKTFHADKTLGKYLPVDHPGTAPDGRTDKAHPRPERHDTSREQHLPAVPARKYRIRYGETARFAPENRATEPGGEDRPHPAYVFRMAFLYEAGTARSTETRVRKYPDAGITHRADGTTATAAGLSFP